MAYFCISTFSKQNSLFSLKFRSNKMSKFFIIHKRKLARQDIF
ncbi:hypothetical protein ATCC51561_438 [Campylobacter concisus ATCC 51561]|nr:hypothetical protein ATCC51561_438 [Campylobacter concisus ATCC 51561]